MKYYFKTNLSFAFAADTEEKANTIIQNNYFVNDDFFVIENEVDINDYKIQDGEVLLKTTEEKESEVIAKELTTARNNRDTERDDWVINIKNFIAAEYDLKNIDYKAIQEMNNIETYYNLKRVLPCDFPLNEEDPNMIWWTNNAPILYQWASQKINEGTLSVIPPKI